MSDILESGVICNWLAIANMAAADNLVRNFGKFRPLDLVTINLKIIPHFVCPYVCPIIFNSWIVNQGCRWFESNRRSHHRLNDPSGHPESNHDSFPHAQYPY